MDLSNWMTRHSHMDFKKQKNGCLAKKAKWHFSHLCDPPAVQAQYSCFIILLPISVQNWSSGFFNQQNSLSCLDILDAVQAPKTTTLQKDFLSIGTFSFLNLMIFRLSRIIVDIMARGISLSDLSWALESKFHTFGFFSLYLKTLFILRTVDCLCEQLFIQTLKLIHVIW